jgi:hypothetical protein
MRSHMEDTGEGRISQGNPIPIDRLHPLLYIPFLWLSSQRPLIAQLVLLLTPLCGY